MERIAHELNMDPLEFRSRNFLKKGDRLVKGFVPRMVKDNPLPTMIEMLKESSNYLERKYEVEEFNRVKRLFYITDFHHYKWKPMSTIFYAIIDTCACSFR